MTITALGDSKFSSTKLLLDSYEFFLLLLKLGESKLWLCIDYLLAGLSDTFLNLNLRVISQNFRIIGLDITNPKSFCRPGIWVNNVT